MNRTMIEKIISAHCQRTVKAGEIVEVGIDVRIARDFGGANVVKNILDNDLFIDDPSKTYFTFDCNPTGSDQKYTTNQQICRRFARERGIKVYDINSGIGTHIAIDEGIIKPGGTLISTDSHANILGAVGAFGQGMGDRDIAAAWAFGKIWFKVPKTIKIILKGRPSEKIYAKDVVLNLLKNFGASGLLGYAAEIYGEWTEDMTLDERITIASMATEMGGIIILFRPNKNILSHFNIISRDKIEKILPDMDAEYEREVEIDISKIRPLISRPGHPEDVVDVEKVEGIKIDSAFIGSCTNGRFEDMKTAAKILKGKRVAPGVVLKIVPSTREIWKRCLDEGIIETFIKAGALVGNPGCAGCAAGQIGQNGPGEVTISTGNRNFVGKQGKGDVYLASPATVAASAISGVIVSEDKILKKPVIFVVDKKIKRRPRRHESINVRRPRRPIELIGRIWVIRIDNIDTDMIFHNRYLTITDAKEMARYALNNIEGWEDFPEKAKKGDIIVTGKNFGAGSSRQQAVDCFIGLGIQAIVAKSFGAIYERNAINSGFPIVVSDLIERDIKDGEKIKIDLKKGIIERIETGEVVECEPFFEIQMELYQRGGLL